MNSKITIHHWKKPTKKKIFKREMDYEHVIKTFLLGKFLALASLNYMDDEHVSSSQDERILAIKKKNRKAKKFNPKLYETGELTLKKINNTK